MILADLRTMSYAYLFQCSSCGHDEELILGAEFERDARGTLLPFRAPAADMIEWPVRRPVGLYHSLWCGDCRHSRIVVLLERPRPVEHPVELLLEAEARGLQGLEGGCCEVCGAELKHSAESLPCPCCESGLLTLVGEYEPAP